MVQQLEQQLDIARKAKAKFFPHAS
jgi:hypothetical protein